MILKLYKLDTFNIRTASKGCHQVFAARIDLVGENCYESYLKRK